MTSNDAAVYRQYNSFSAVLYLIIHYRTSKKKVAITLIDIHIKKGQPSLLNELLIMYKRKRKTERGYRPSSFSSWAISATMSSTLSGTTLHCSPCRHTDTQLCGNTLQHSVDVLWLCSFCLLSVFFKAVRKSDRQQRSA